MAKNKEPKKSVVKGAVCPGCGKVYDVEFMRVVDKKPVPGEAHYQALEMKPAEGGLPFEEGDETEETPEVERPEVQARD